jgi:NAD-dependent deacetylase
LQLLMKVQREAATCEVMLLIGTSAVVQPAANLPLIARQNGAKVIEINPENEYSGADCVIKEKAGTALPAILTVIGVCP